MNNNRQQRCIELFDRLKAQFLRAYTLDDADKGYIPDKESNDFNRQMADRDAALFALLLSRLTSHMGTDDFNSNWSYYSDYIYQDG
jgi:hypothetical protein